MGDKTLKWFIGGILLVMTFVLIMILFHKNDKEEFEIFFISKNSSSYANLLDSKSFANLSKCSKN